MKLTHVTIRFPAKELQELEYLYGKKAEGIKHAGRAFLFLRAGSLETIRKTFGREDIRYLLDVFEGDGFLNLGKEYVLVEIDKYEKVMSQPPPAMLRAKIKMLHEADVVVLMEELWRVVYQVITGEELVGGFS